MITKNSIYSAAIAFLFLGQIPTGIQAQQSPLWEVEVNGNIQWQKVTSLGNVIVSTGTALHGIDPATGKVSWSLSQIQFAMEDNFESIQGSPFFSVTDNKGGFYIVEPFEGKIMFSSTEAGLEKISDKFFLYKSKSILILGYEAGKKEPSMVMIDMNTGKKSWSKGGEFSRITACYDLGNDEFVVSSLFFVYKLNSENGNEIWKKCLDAKFEKMGSLLSLMDKGAGNSQTFGNRQMNGALVVTDYAKDLVFMAGQKESQKTVKGADGKTTTTVEYSTFYNAFKLSTGEYAWASALEINGKFGLLIPNEKGLIITHGTMNMNNSAVNCLDYKTGTTLWGKKGKGIDVKGQPAGTANIGSKIIISSANDSKSFIYSLNPSNGTMDFEKPAKIDGQIEYIEPLDKGLLIATNEEIDFLVSATGEFGFEKSLKGNKNSIVSNDKTVYIFSGKDDLLYSMSRSATSASPLSKAPLKFQGKEDPTKMEIRSKGILISSEQNIAMIDMNGALLFNKYYPAPDQPGWKKALLIANAVYGAYATAVYAYSSAAFGAVSQSIVVKNPESQVAKDMTGAISNAYGDAANSGMSFTKKCVDAAGMRFKATSQSSSCMFMMVELGKKQYGLIQVNKDSGEKTATIDMAKDKSPSYDLDMVTSTVYYKTGEKKIQAYTFK